MAGYGPFDDTEPLAVMADIRAFALAEVKPAVSTEAWDEADIVQIHASMDALGGKLTDRELELKSIEYTTLIHNLAVEAGALSW